MRGLADCFRRTRSRFLATLRADGSPHVTAGLDRLGLLPGGCVVLRRGGTTAAPGV